MKYKTFRNGAIAVVVVAAAGAGVWALLGRPRPAPPPPPPPPPVLAPASEPQPPPPAPTAPAGQTPLRPIDKKILERLKQPIAGSDKVKDAFKSEAIKVNLYQEAGRELPNRVKLDLDRDDKWDEKWTVDGGRIVREVSSGDDDRTYDQRFLLAGEAWAREGAAPAEAPAATPPPPAALPVGAQALRPLDDEILALARAGITADRVKDATTGKPYKVSLYRDPGKPGVSRLKVDLDRDEKWDEKWTFDGDAVKRQVAPADDEQYSEEYRLRGGAWVRK